MSIFITVFEVVGLGKIDMGERGISSVPTDGSALDWDSSAGAVTAEDEAFRGVERSHDSIAVGEKGKSN